MPPWLENCSNLIRGWPSIQPRVPWLSSRVKMETWIPLVQPSPLPPPIRTSWRVGFTSVAQRNGTWCDTKPRFALKDNKTAWPKQLPHRGGRCGGTRPDWARSPSCSQVHHYHHATDGWNITEDDPHLKWDVRSTTEADPIPSASCSIIADSPSLRISFGRPHHGYRSFSTCRCRFVLNRRSLA